MLGRDKRARPEIEVGDGPPGDRRAPTAPRSPSLWMPKSMGKTKGVCSHQCSVCLSKDYVRVTTPSAVIQLQEGSQEGVT